MNGLFKNIRLYQKPIFFISTFVTTNFLFLYRKSIYNYFLGLLNYTPVQKKSILSLSDEYVENKKKKCIDFINADVDKANANMDSEYYNKEEYTNAISEADNELEKKWRRKIYNEHTPRGNVYMHYDAYKMGFSYYSDTSIPNPILNAVAMQYCIMFKCCDLFIDQNIISKENESPLIKIHHIEKKKTKNNKNVNKGDVTKSDDLPFAKLKNYNKEKINEKKTKKKSGEEKKDNPFVNKVTNKFIHLGKVYKLNWLQPIKKEQTTIKFESKYLDDLQKETDLQKQVMSYKDYKNAAATATTKILH